MSKYHGIWKNETGEILRVACSEEEGMFWVQWLFCRDSTARAGKRELYSSSDVRRLIRIFKLKKE